MVKVLPGKKKSFLRLDMSLGLRLRFPQCHVIPLHLTISGRNWHISVLGIAREVGELMWVLFGIHNGHDAYSDSFGWDIVLFGRHFSRRISHEEYGELKGKWVFI